MGNKVVERVVDRKERGQQGQALIEFALVLPLLFWLIVNVVNFGGLLYAWVTVANAARAGADYWLMGSSYAHSSGKPTASQVSTIVTTDLLSLPNRSSATVTVCYNIGGTTTCSPSGGAIPSDPVTAEAGLYVVGTVDVTYTYVPFIQNWTFSNLKIGLWLGPNNVTVHRRAAVRMV
jgi:Flp pilus assembly protein TadG